MTPVILFPIATALATRHSLLISNCLVLFEQIFRIKNFLSLKCTCVNHAHLQVDHSILRTIPVEGPPVGWHFEIFFPLIWNPVHKLVLGILDYLQTIDFRLCVCVGNIWGCKPRNVLCGMTWVGCFTAACFAVSIALFLDTNPLF